MTQFFEEQYLKLIDHVLSKGIPVYNQRTGQTCLSIPFYQFHYKIGISPLTTVRKSLPVSAFAEILGYLRGYTNAEEFDRIGAKTWYVNANNTKAWLENPNRKGENDLGRVYGAIGRDFGGIDLVQDVYNKLRSRKDDRGLCITFWKPDDFDKGCLRPCLKEHNFQLIGNNLFLTSIQRSADIGCGIPFNAIQVYLMLELFAKITGNVPVSAEHIVMHPHIYYPHIEGLKTLLTRKPLENKGSVSISNWVNTLGHVMEKSFVSKDYLTMSKPECPYEPIQFDLVA